MNEFSVSNVFGSLLMEPKCVDEAIGPVTVGDKWNHGWRRAGF